MQTDGSSSHLPSAFLKIAALFNEIVRHTCARDMLICCSDILSLPVRLRQMPAELLRYPSRALKVKVAGFKAPTVNRQEDVLPYSPKWSVKAAMDMIELLHNNITATVVVRNKQHNSL